MLKETLLLGEKIDKVKTSLERLKTFEPAEGYYLAFSGGKDSIVIKHLADIAKVKYDAHYSVTTIDPPELTRFIREYHPDVEFDQPKKPFLKEMIYRGFPLRQARWCCAEYKERGGSGRLVVTGIRWAESSKRKQRRLVENCYKDVSKRYLNVIIDWEDADVWQFIREEKLPYCELYDRGWDRIGCVLCPFLSENMRKMQKILYPHFVRAFRVAFRKLYADKKAKGLTSVDRWKDGDAMFDWWSSRKVDRYNPDQRVMFE